MNAENSEPNPPKGRTWKGRLVDAVCRLIRGPTSQDLSEAKARYRQLIEFSPDANLICRGQSLLFANLAAVQMFGYEGKQHLLAQSLRELIHPDSHHFLPTLEAQDALPCFEVQFLDINGRRIDAEVRAATTAFDNTPATHLVIRDITKQKAAAESLTLAASVFTHANEGIMITTDDGVIIDVNESFTKITGFTREEAFGQNPRILSSGRQSKEHYASMWKVLAETGEWHGEICNRRKSGEYYIQMQTISAVHDSRGNTLHYVALFSDVTAMKEHQKQLQDMAHFDSLTSLPNRVLLSDRLHQGMVQAHRQNSSLAVVYLDLDGFKDVNDRYGHDVGDQLLMAIAAQMKEALREGDTLARMGGDEFVAVLLDLGNLETSKAVLDRLLEAANQPIQVGELNLTVSISLGVTFYPQSKDIDADQLIRQADQAMYQAKIGGKNRLHVFDSVQDHSIRGHHEDLERVRKAYENNEFVLHYQPRVNMREGEMVGVEALIRWNHPEKGLLPPSEFLPLIEDHPLSIDIGEWVLNTVLAQVEAWKSVGTIVPVSINVSAIQLQQDDFASRLHACLLKHPAVDPSWIEFEVLETSALNDLKGVSKLISECQKLGVNFSLDDFGTGYSSLTYLKHLPVNFLKIDQSFVLNMHNNPDDLAILEGVIGLASAFRRNVIAEGVESIEHGVLLLQLGCEFAQGFGIARPMPAEDLLEWARTWKVDPKWLNLDPVSREDLPGLRAEVEYRAWAIAMELDPNNVNMTSADRLAAKVSMQEYTDLVAPPRTLKASPISPKRLL